MRSLLRRLATSDAEANAAESVFLVLYAGILIGFALGLLAVTVLSPDW